jgi:hypothetical protein
MVSKGLWIQILFDFNGFWWSLGDHFGRPKSMLIR